MSLPEKSKPPVRGSGQGQRSSCECDQRCRIHAPEGALQVDALPGEKIMNRPRNPCFYEIPGADNDLGLFHGNPVRMSQNLGFQ